jgi:hypothetical protein
LVIELFIDCVSGFVGWLTGWLSDGLGDILARWLACCSIALLLGKRLVDWPHSVPVLFPGCTDRMW